MMTSVAFWTVMPPAKPCHSVALKLGEIGHLPAAVPNSPFGAVAPVLRLADCLVRAMSSKRNERGSRRSQGGGQERQLRMKYITGRLTLDAGPSELFRSLKPGVSESESVQSEITNLRRYGPSTRLALASNLALPRNFPVLNLRSLERLSSRSSTTR